MLSLKIALTAFVVAAIANAIDNSNVKDHGKLYKGRLGWQSVIVVAAFFVLGFGLHAIWTLG